MPSSDEPRSADAQPSELNLRAMRAARNQALFREVNERLNEVNRAFAEVIPVGDFVCECSNAECTQRIGLTKDEYESLRANPTWFAVRRGHEKPELETTVVERSTYAIVEKTGPAAAYVTRVDPRTRPAENLRRRSRPADKS